MSLINKNSPAYKKGYNDGIKYAEKHPSDTTLDNVRMLAHMFTAYYVYFAETPDKCELNNNDKLREMWENMCDMSPQEKFEQYLKRGND